jgi:hypothetical protein
MTPLTAEEVEALQIDAIVGALALLFVAAREERRSGEDRRATPREGDRRAELLEVWDRR